MQYIMYGSTTKRLFLTVWVMAIMQWMLFLQVFRILCLAIIEQSGIGVYWDADCFGNRYFISRAGDRRHFSLHL